MKISPGPHSSLAGSTLVNSDPLWLCRSPCEEELWSPEKTRTDLVQLSQPPNDLRSGHFSKQFLQDDLFTPRTMFHPIF